LSKRLMFSLFHAVLGRMLPALCSAKPVSLCCFKKSFSVVFYQPFVGNSFINLLALQPFDYKFFLSKSPVTTVNRGPYAPKCWSQSLVISVLRRSRDVPMSRLGHSHLCLVPKTNLQPNCAGHIKKISYR